MHAHAAYDTYYYDGVYTYAPGAPYFDFARTRWWTGDAMVSPHLGRRHKLEAGGEVRVVTRRAQYSSEHDVGFGALSDPRVWGVFVQDEITVFPRLTFVAGVRYDDLGSAQSKTSPRVALVFKPRQSTALKLLASDAFRAPNAFEQGYWRIQPLLPKLHPEKIDAVEIVAEHYTGNGLRLSFSMYRHFIDDLISQTADAAGNLGYINGSDILSHGLSVEVEKRFQSGWYLRGAWSAQRSLNPATQLVISNSPAHVAKFAVNIPLFHRRADLGITDRAASHVLNVRRVPVPGQNQTDITLSTAKPWRKTE
ncbi:MAG: TonB-dependent receptor plug domain-containing protein, partial [Mycobacteriales bacterium]